jgi:hypothetical protein
MKQTELITEIKRLCNEHKHDDAIKLTNEIEDKSIAVEAHLLCIEHEWRCLLEGHISIER